MNKEIVAAFGSDDRKPIPTQLEVALVLASRLIGRPSLPLCSS